MDPQSQPAPNGAGPDNAQPPGAGQPPANQGGQGGVEEAVAGLYDLNSVPPELRPHVEPELKKVQASVTQRFQEHADYRDQWKPYEELGLNDYEPEDLAQLLQFGQVLQDPQTVKQLVQDADAFEDWWSQIGDTMGFFADDDDPAGGGQPPEQQDPEALRAQIRDEVMQELEPVFELARNQQNSQRLQEANEEIDQKLAAVKQQHGEFSDDPEEAKRAEDTILKLALAYDGDDDIERAYQDWVQLVGGAERGLVEQTGRQPAAPEQREGARPGDDAITTFEDAKQAAKRRLAATPS